LKTNIYGGRLAAVLFACGGLAAQGLHAQSITISPGYLNLGVNATQQYAATVTGLTPATVTWEVNGVVGGNTTVGRITAAGLYTAPAAIPKVSVLISAIGSDNKTEADVYVNLAPAGPTITATTPASPIPNGNYTVTLTGSGFAKGAYVLENGASYGTTFISSTSIKVSGYHGGTGAGGFQVQNPGSLWGPVFAVTWGTVAAQTISPTAVSVKLGATQQFTSAGATTWTATAGTISNAGLFTAPATMPASPTVTVKATGPGGTASATVTLTNANPQVISPTTVSVNLGATQQFTSAGATTWSATAGTISTSGLFTAPATMPASPTVTVKATGPGGTASATVTLTNANPQVISPATASLNLGATQQFTSAGATTWSALYGTITTAGFYTAPAALPASGTDTVTVIGTSGTATATVTLNPPTPVILSVGTNGQLPLGLFTTTVTGTGFTAKSVASLNGTPLTTTFGGGALTVSGFAAQSGAANMVVTNGTVSSPAFAVQVGIPNALVSAAAARRFLQQAGFGPTPSDAAHVQAIGFQAWLNEQFAMAPVSNFNSLAGSSQGGMSEVFLANAVTNPDQLRQKVAFALSQIFVTSFQTVIWNGDMIPYQQMLLSDAFTTYGQILNDVTLSPAMGEYLNMANNAAANPAAGTVANENYAREIMQLFSIGTVMLNQDGSVQSNAGGPIPTYSQKDVTELARVFTGWTYPPTTPGAPINWGSYINSANGPMVPYAPQHDFGQKNLINGYVAAANLSPQADLTGALNNIVAHPNTAPFISKQLIQHLVKSNPSPAYIQRVANAFTQNNGDMKSVITAILLDTEARANDEGGNDLPADGHFQEPALFLTGLVRALGGQMTSANYYQQELGSMGQDIYDAPSVFNYYSPSYRAGGTGGLLAPELQIDNPNSAILRENEIYNLFSQYSNPVASNGPGTTIDLTPLLPLAATPATLVNAIDLTLTRGVMPAAMKSIITNAVVADAGSGSLHQVQTAIYLTLVSGYYNVWH
jgi:uncharacterized protein (DUF1800 family)